MTPVAEAPAQTPVRPYSLAFLGFVWVPGGREPGYLAPPAHVIATPLATCDNERSLIFNQKLFYAAFIIKTLSSVFCALYSE